MLKMKKVSDTYDIKVFTDTGEYFGDVEDSIIQTNKVAGWKIKSTKNSFLSRVIGSAKGVIVPHQLVKAVGDILIISKSAVPTGTMDDEEPAAE
jgi:sporulation protein YlmC with PRC-barrel domain